ncbi:fas1 domain-containing [Trichoderma arundinaceum]|uniref:Fas1 domain-containing n=1 Tax=Trichoderma arundinaceum TaxID=490622 RepID=A0A395P0C8_TRIAR|nr:fas1 domain-containing [Trichoderma arundinaceum]
MVKVHILFLYLLGGFSSADVVHHDPLEYFPAPSGTYVPPKDPSIRTLLDVVKSRDDLSILAEVLSECAGFGEAFDTAPSWSYTFFAPSDTAFRNTGAYYSTFAATPKGKWWLGNLLQHHYVPNSKLMVENFNATYTRFQTGTFLFVGAQVVDGKLTLNKVSSVTEADIPITNGILHIIDHLLDPSAQIFEADVPKNSQGFIPGSCSNPALPYC